MRFSLCGSCRRRYWPYVTGLFVSGIVAFLTWLTLDAAGLQGLSNERWTVALFFCMLACTWSYTYTCVRRHCRAHSPSRAADS